MRKENRAFDELRKISLQLDYLKHAAGSVLIEAGDTHLICAASIENKIPPHLYGSDKGWITAEYGMLPMATASRAVREAARGRQSGRTLEIQRLIGRALRAAVDLRAISGRTIWIDCDVLQADGGTRTAAITGGFIAMTLALARQVRAGEIGSPPLLNFVAATSVGIVGGYMMLDLDYSEDSIAEVDMNVVMNGAGRFIELQGTAESKPFSRDQLSALLDLAQKGISELIELQKQALASKITISDVIRV